MGPELGPGKQKQKEGCLENIQPLAFRDFLQGLIPTPTPPPEYVPPGPGGIVLGQRARAATHVTMATLMVLVH